MASCTASQIQPIEWLSWEEGEAVSKKKSQNILVFIHDPSCQTCETFEEEILQHPEISSLISENFVSIKLDANRKEDISTQGKVWKNVRDPYGNQIHELAKALTKSTDAFELPALAFLDKDMGLIAPVKGTITAAKLEVLLKYVGKNKFRDVAFETFADTVSTVIRE